MNSGTNITRSRRFFLMGMSALVCGAPGAMATEEADAKEAFLKSSFESRIPMSKVLWLTRDLKSQVKKILKHAYPALRVRYWQDGSRTAWVLDEIGKYKPITVGIVVQNGAIEQLKVLAYRESHGWEVRHDFFTRQFIGAKLPKPLQLDRNIDGISGATLSVRALKKLAILALFLDQTVQKP